MQRFGVRPLEQWPGRFAAPPLCLSVRV